MGETITMEIMEGEEERVIKAAGRAADTIEPGTVISLDGIGGESLFTNGETGNDAEEDDEKNSELKKQILRIAAGGILFAAGLLLNLKGYAELLVFFSAYIIVGGEVLAEAVKGFFKGNVFGEELLMGIATVGAFLIGEYPEAVAVMLFFRVGEYFQDKAVDNSRKSIKSLMDIRPDSAGLKTENGVTVVSPAEVKVGDIIVVKPGEKIPLDGEIIRGMTHADTSALTGESMPRELNEGDRALSGMINGEGLIEIRVESPFSESTVSRILSLVSSASEKKAKTENFITRFARVYTPLVVLAAFLLAFIPPLVTGGNLRDWIYRALVFLVVSCPCALVLSVPLGFFAGIGASSKMGVLVKGSNYLEALNDVKTVVFDKTGTLTEGKFTVTELNPSDSGDKDTLLYYAAAAERNSGHPIAKSIMKYYGENLEELEEDESSTYEEIRGKGIRTVFKGKEILAGNSSFLQENGVDPDIVTSGGTAVYIAADRKFMGSVVIADEIKKDSAEAVKELKKLGIEKTVMLTGDRKETAEAVGKTIGIDEVYSELLPEDKVRILEKIQSENSGKTLFTGDGINDAPVIARADLGAAMGGLGSDAAIEAADIVILSDDPSGLVRVKKAAGKTRRIVIQNIVFALGVKAVILLLGALGKADMWMAVFADIGVSLIAVMNSIRVLNTKGMDRAQTP